MTKTMSHHPHPFHIVGECQGCCDESEALRTGYEGPFGFPCEEPTCVNYEANDAE